LQSYLELIVTTPEGKVDMTVQPADAYTWALAATVFQKVFRCRTCRKVITGNIYCSRKCEIEASKTGAKQRFLDYLDKQLDRNKITAEEYNFAKGMAKKLQRDGMKDDILKNKVIRALSEKWKDKDHSFLEGFGTKRSGRG